ncbi:MAG TPA: SusC/RagA family TonB-linked outer membrane protein [Bacteroidales bacterium]|nr:SusC/RagA family TonB-linked outer membrane protein [Bacteroidales bacterium]
MNNSGYILQIAFLKLCSIKTLRIMKLTNLLLVVTVFNLFGSETYSQQTSLNLDMKDVPIQRVLNAIEEQSEFFFLYSSKMIDVNKIVNIKVADEKINAVLEELLANSGIKYTIRDRQILLVDKETEATSILQQRITGTITDSKTGEAMPGVNVLIEGTTIGTITDASGKYSIDKPSDNVILIISFIGYTTQRISADGSTVVDVKLEALLTSLDEVVVTGYSTQRRKDITGSVSIVDINNVKRLTSRSAVETLQGMASGVNVIRSGVPGATSKIFIRGITNFGDTDPLIIVDGIEQNLNNISIKDIESIQVLKDAGAASIYGVRGANGVILVTTKKGKTGAPVISYEATIGMQYPLTGNPLNLLNSQDYMAVFNQAFPGNVLYKDGLPDYTYMGPGGSGVAMEGDPRVNPSQYFLEAPNKGRNYVIQKVNKEGTDWWDEVYEKAPFTEHNLSASGGTDKANYLFAIGYLNQQGTNVNSYVKRYSVRINTEFKAGKHLRIGENINLIIRDIGAVSGSVAPYGLQSIVPVKDIMGNWAGSFGGPLLGQSGNPVAAQYRNVDDINNEWYQIGNVYAELDFLKNFKARTSLGYNFGQSFRHDFSTCPYETSESNNALNSLTITSGLGRTMTFTNTLNYKKTFDNHDLNVLIGSEAIEYQSRNVSGTKKDFFSEAPSFQVLDNGQSGIMNSSYIYKHALFSLFSRLDYSYSSKYLLSVTVRRDGSSRFGPEQKYGAFPAVSLGWRISNESFMKSLTWLNDMKIRGSYGVLGSQSNVDALNQYTLYYSGKGYPDPTDHYYDLAGTGNSAIQGFGIQRYGNTDTGWEENLVTNLGFDATILNNSLDISVEYYKKAINGLLFTAPKPAVVGEGSSPKINIGDIQNTGIDGTITYRGKIISDLHFSVGLNLTTYKNDVVDIPDPGYFDVGVVRNQEGFPVSSFFGYKVIGLFNSTEDVAAAPIQNGAAPGRFQFLDANGDGIISPTDRVHLGDPNPDFTYGITLGLDYKDFDFSGIFYGVQGNELFNTTRAYLHFFQYYNGAKGNALLRAWTPENTNTTVPKIESTGSFSTSQVPNSYYIEDGSYFRLKSLVLGYTIKQNVLQKVGISSFRVYAQATNLFTITNYTGLDPELGGATSSFGLDFGNYPDSELGMMFGLNVTF